MSKKTFLMILVFVAVSVSFFAIEGNTIPIESESFSKEQIKNIEIQVTYEDVEIKETYGNEILVEIYSNNRKTVPSISTFSDTLLIESKAHLFLRGTECDIKLYIPQNAKFSNVKITSASADIEISKINAENIKLHSASGDIDCKILDADEEINLESASGDIEIEEANSKEITVKSNSGEISLNRISSDTLTAQIIGSGEIDINDFYGEYVQVTSKSGDIEIERLDAEYFSLNSASGKISVDMKNIPAASSKINTTSGNVQLFVPHNKGFNLTVSSNSGTFRDRINDNRFVPRSEFSQKYYGGGTDIFIRTTSGEILLEN